MKSIFQRLGTIALIIFTLAGLMTFANYVLTPVFKKLNSGSYTTPENKVVENKSKKNNYVLPETLEGKGITDVFHGKFYSKLNDSGSSNGQRFLVSVVSRQMGNAQNTVTVNDSTIQFGSSLKMGTSSPEYNFYAKYDAKNRWYTIMKAARTPNFIDP